jgi:hypothetical protein
LLPGVDAWVKHHRASRLCAPPSRLPSAHARGARFFIFSFAACSQPPAACLPKLSGIAAEQAPVRLVVAPGIPSLRIRCEFFIEKRRYPAGREGPSAGFSRLPPLAQGPLGRGTFYRRQAPIDLAL